MIYDYTSEREKLKRFCEEVLKGTFEEHPTEPKYKCIIFTNKPVNEMIEEIENIIKTKIHEINNIVNTSEFTIELRNESRNDVTYSNSVSYTINKQYTIRPDVYVDIKINITKKVENVSNNVLREESVSELRKIKEFLKEIIGVNNN